MMMRFVLTGILTLMAAGVGFLTFDWYRGKISNEPFGAPFELVSAAGEAMTEQDFRGHPNAVFFGFTHCPEVCPTTLFELDGWLKALGGDGENIRAWFVTVDPERDTPEVMKNYIANLSGRITGITGDPDKIAKMLKDFSIYARKVETGNGEYTMDHTASILLLDSDGAFFGTISYQEDPETAKAKLRRLAQN